MVTFGYACELLSRRIRVIILLTYLHLLCKQIDMIELPVSSPSDPEVLQRYKAYQVLRRLLILDQIQKGARLREPIWAKQLGVNRMALREAFARLEAEGLIERGPKTGYFVPRLTSEDIREILEVRSSLEAMAIRAIIREKRNTRRHLTPLQRAIDQLEVMIDNSYILGASESDRRFHECLVELAGNRRLTMIYLSRPAANAACPNHQHFRVGTGDAKDLEGASQHARSNTKRQN